MEFSFSHLSCLNPCLDWCACVFWLGRAVTQRGCRSAVPVFISMGWKQCAEGGILKWASLLAALTWGITGFWVSSVFLLPSHPENGRTRTSVLHSHLPGEGSCSEFWLVPYCPDPELDNKQENQMSLSLPGPAPGNQNQPSATFSLPRAPHQLMEPSQWDRTPSKHQKKQYYSRAPHSTKHTRTHARTQARTHAHAPSRRLEDSSL